MIKVHYDTDQESLLRRFDGRLFFFAEDLNGFRKQASSSVFTPAQLEALRPPPGQWLCHNVIVGGQEAYGQNRNGDGWPKLACINRHGTFVTHGHAYREHRNRDKKEAIGLIKASAWHPALERIETVKWYDRDKTEKEYEMAKSGKQLSFSMSARVPWDECSCCGHRAKRASDYCPHLRDSMNQWLPEFQKYAYAINREPTFYDDSVVANPADRIAHYLEYAFQGDEMKKAASANLVITGEDWARYEGVTIPDLTEPVPFSLTKLAMLTKLAADEEFLDWRLTEHTPKSAFVKEMTPRLNLAEISEDDVNVLRGLQVGTVFRELAKRASVMPFISFCATYAHGTSIQEARESEVVKVAAAKYLPHVFTNMLAAGDNPELGDMFQASSDFMSSIDTSKDAAADRVLTKMGHAYCIEPEAVQARVWQEYDNVPPRPELGIDMTKSAANVDSDARILAEAYGHYQLRALCDMENLRGGNITDAQLVLNVAGNRSIYR